MLRLAAREISWRGCRVTKTGHCCFIISLTYQHLCTRSRPLSSLQAFRQNLVWLMAKVHVVCINRSRVLPDIVNEHSPVGLCHRPLKSYSTGLSKSFLFARTTPSGKVRCVVGSDGVYTWRRSAWPWPPPEATFRRQYWGPEK